MRFRFKYLIILFVVTISLNANANIIYNIDRVVGTGTVSGFIETDGTLGSLANSNILNFDFILNSPSLSNGPNVTVSSATGGTLQSGGGANLFTATGTTLSYDFGSSVNAYSLFWAAGFGNYYCFETSGCTGLASAQGQGAESFGYPNNGDAANIFTASEIIGIAGQIPVPTPLALLGLGLAAIGYTRQRKSA